MSEKRHVFFLKMDTEIVIIGAGVVGLAIAEKLSSRCSGIYIIERNHSFGQETSSRNSEVIHAGIYYKAGSLKAKLCLKGREMLYDFCRKYEVPYKKCGKLIVATNYEETLTLEKIVKTASLNGLEDLKIIDQDEISVIEPEIRAHKAILSPSTGIIDSHFLMKQLETNFLNNGGNIVYGSEVKKIMKQRSGYLITLTDADGSPFSFSASMTFSFASGNIRAKMLVSFTFSSSCSFERLRTSFPVSTCPLCGSRISLAMAMAVSG